MTYSNQLGSPVEDKNANIATIRLILSEIREKSRRRDSYLNLNQLRVIENRASGIPRDFKRFNPCHACLSACCEELDRYEYDYCCYKPEAPSDQAVLDYMNSFNRRVDLFINSLHYQEREDTLEAARQGVFVGPEESIAGRFERVLRSQVMERDPIVTTNN